MTNEKELIGTTWDYQGISGTNNFVPIYAGRWKVSDIHGDRAVLKQDECECAGKEGSSFYVSYSSKKCIEIPISRLQREFRRYFAQNIVAEPVKVRCPSKQKEFVAVSQRVSPIMTNRDIQKSIEDRNKNWSDKECNDYIANKNKCNGVCGSPSKSNGKKTISMISEIFDAAFGKDITDKLLDFLKAGSKFAAIATSVSGPFEEWEKSPFSDALKDANKEFDESRDRFARAIRRHYALCKRADSLPSRECPKGYDNDGPCRKQMDFTKEPRCSNFDCEL